jgi:transcriptional regulator with XRE-family HTH domain
VVGRRLYELHTARGLTQRQLAELVGTTRPVFARLEDADYEGRTLSVLSRIAESLGCFVVVGRGAAALAAPDTRSWGRRVR